MGPAYAPAPLPPVPPRFNVAPELAPAPPGSSYPLIEGLLSAPADTIQAAQVRALQAANDAVYADLYHGLGAALPPPDPWAADHLYPANQMSWQDLARQMSYPEGGPVGPPMTEPTPRPRTGLELTMRGNAPESYGLPDRQSPRGDVLLAAGRDPVQGSSGTSAHTAYSSKTTPEDSGDPRFERYYKEIERREGLKFTNKPNDPGGPTKIGVIQDTLTQYHAWKGIDATDIPAEARKLERRHAKRIYWEFYYKKYKIDKIEDDRLAEQLLDTAIIPGPSQAGRWLQQGLNIEAGAGLEEDGAIGPSTRKAANTATPEQLRRIGNYIAERRERYFRSKIEENPAKQDYRSGWRDRARSFRQDK